MSLHELGVAKAAEAEKTTPGIFSVLGVVVLDVVILFLFWFIAMIAMTAAWTLFEFISNAGHISANAEPGTSAQLLISLLGLYLAISALAFWRARKLDLPQVEMSSRKRAIIAFSGGAGVFFLTLLLMNLLEYFGMASKPANQEMLQTLGSQWPLATLILRCCWRPSSKNCFSGNSCLRGWPGQIAQHSHTCSAACYSL